jgi:glycosyltransferase involved in cell wall biosynthesis
VKRVLSYKPNLVYYTLSPTGYAFYRDACYVFLLKLLNQKIVFHLHGKGINNNVKDNILKKYLYRWVFKNTYVICLSESLTFDIQEVYFSIPIIVPNGIKLEQYLNRANHKTDSIPQILFLSNYKRDKGILILIEALSILKNKGFDYSARLVGAPGDLSIEFLENLIKGQHLTEYIQVLGPLYGNDKINEFQNADIFVFPTKNEAFPLVILEAFQYALPVISTFEGGIPDIVSDNKTGLLVETQNPEMLADKIAILLENKNLRIEMGRKGHEKFINNFTLAHFEKNMNKTFQSILGIN